MTVKKSVIARLSALKSEKFTLQEILKNLIFYRKMFSCIVHFGNVELLYFQESLSMRYGHPKPAQGYIQGKVLQQLGKITTGF
jgi:hypothetical protein